MHTAVYGEMLKITQEYGDFSRDFWFQTVISLDSVRDFTRALLLDKDPSVLLYFVASCIIRTLNSFHTIQVV